MTTRVAAALAAASLVGSLGAATALGHSELESSTPRNGAVLARTPARVTLTFHGVVVRLGRITATRNRADDLVRSAVISPRNASRVVIRLKRPGPRKQPGAYRVSWRVTGADGHVVSGAIGFRVRR
jgi:methionine-rich copper-binding protein CopC